LFDDLAPAVVSFAGKEVFADARSAEIAFEAIRLRDELQVHRPYHTHIGLITNGTLLHRFQTALITFPPDHVDVSVDGLPAFHNQLRGPGAFARLEPNLRWLVAEFPNPIWITHTLFSTNLRAVPRFVEYYSDTFGLRHFSLGFYHSLPYTSPKLTVAEGDYVSFVEGTLQKLSRIDVPGSVNVIVDFGAESAAVIRRLEDNGWVESSEAISSSKHAFDNGVTLRVNVSRVPVGLWRAVRVTPEGYWLAAEDLVYAREYAQRAVAQLRDYSFNTRTAYNVGLAYLRNAARSGNGTLLPSLPTMWPSRDPVAASAD